MAQPLTSLPVDQLQPNPYQPRQKLLSEDLQELIDSIKSHGVLEPLVIAETPVGYQIIAGERRWRAAKAAGLTEVPVHVRKTSPKGMLEMALVENVQRVDLGPIERAQAFAQLEQEFGYGPSDIAQKIGKSVPYISNTLKLLKLPDAVKDGLIGGLISEGHARALQGIPDQSSMIDCYKIVLRENASVRRTEDLARRYRQKLGISSHTRSRTIVSPNIDAWTKQLSTAFSNQKARANIVRSRIQTKVTIVLPGSPAKTQADLEKILSLAKHSS